MATGKSRKDDPLRNMPEDHRERVRFKVTEAHLGGARGFGGRSDDEVAQEHGYRGGIAEFIDVAFSEPMTVERFVHFLVGFHRRPQAGDDAKSLRRRPETVGMAIRQRMRTARSLKAAWLAEDAAPEPAQFGDTGDRSAAEEHDLQKQNFYRLKGWLVSEPRTAIGYLLSSPMSRDLVADPIREWFEGRMTRSASAAAADSDATLRADVVKALIRLYPDGPPSRDRKRIREAVKEMLKRPISLSTLDRALQELRQAK